MEGVIVLKERINSIVAFFRRCVGEDLITVYAAQASFYIIIASVPFLMLLLAAMQFFLPVDFEKIMGIINTFLPQNLRGLAYRALSELFVKSGSILSLSAITALWTASRGAAAVSRGIRHVYRTSDDRGFVKSVLWSALYTVIFIGMLLITLVILVFGPTITEFLSEHFLLLSGVFALFDKLRAIVFLVVFCLFFALVYRFLSGKNVAFSKQLPGAAFSALGWVIFSLGFSIYIENFSNYSYIYGSLAAIVLMMLWLYFCMIIFLFGAEINVLLSGKGIDNNG
ncbi:MAG: YihY/virulence factor BrkB family protein [Clostridia bacterium]|nr:YihY/virulence factor BrkB family protein [Clostridia bacterium]MBQ8637402.1 YihY/virulence factor BrkB family protein [Clostridia bacterium]